MSTSRQAVNRYFDESAIDYSLVWTNKAGSAYHFGFYDKTVNSHRQALLRANDRIAELAKIGRGSVVVDAGCGVGGTSLWLAGELGAEVIGLTLSERQAGKATESARARRLGDSARFVVGDFARLPVKSGVADAVIAVESLCHGEDKAAFYKEAARILKPGGRLAVAEYVRAERSYTGRERWMMHEWLDGWAIPSLWTAREHLSAAEKVGFANVEMLDVTDNVLPSLVRLYLLSFAGIPTHLILERLGFRGKVGRGNVHAARLQYKALEAGLWFYAHIHARLPG
ncbi:MAG: methyltransferase domain-containing protein [Bauldia sp.]|nr:methyltransferase domain-containing protein [Bauldia sp.]